MVARMELNAVTMSVCESAKYGGIGVSTPHGVAPPEPSYATRLSSQHASIVEAFGGRHLFVPSAPPSIFQPEALYAAGHAACVKQRSFIVLASALGAAPA